MHGMKEVRISAILHTENARSNRRHSKVSGDPGMRTQCSEEPFKVFSTKGKQWVRVQAAVPCARDKHKQCHNEASGLGSKSFQLAQQLAQYRPVTKGLSAGTATGH